MDDLIKRLRGKYSCGPNGIYEDRDFGSYTPKINNEAADRIEQLELDNNRMMLALTSIIKVASYVPIDRTVLNLANDGLVNKLIKRKQ